MEMTVGVKNFINRRVKQKMSYVLYCVTTVLHHTLDRLKTINTWGPSKGSARIETFGCQSIATVQKQVD